MNSLTYAQNRFSYQINQKEILLCSFKTSQSFFSVTSVLKTLITHIVVTKTEFMTSQTSIIKIKSDPNTVLSFYLIC